MGMKLQDVLNDLKLFGFEEAYVRVALGRGDSAFNAFAGIQTSLQLRWGDMNQELGTERLAELKPIYARLMKLEMKSRSTPAAQQAQAEAKISNILDQVLDAAGARGRRNQEAVLAKTKERFAQMAREGKLDEATKANIRASGLGGLIDDL